MSSAVERRATPSLVDPLRRRAPSRRSTSAATASTSSRDAVLVAVVLAPARTTGRRRRTRPCRRAAGARGPACESQLALVEQLRRERADARAPAATSRAGRCRGPAASSGAPPSTCSSAETSTPSGWLAFCGCSSCCGSPSSTRLSRRLRHGERRWRATSARPRRRTARRRRRRTPRAPRARRCRRARRPRRRRARRSASSLSSNLRTPPPCGASSSVVALVRRAGRVSPASAACSRTASSRLRITLWLVAVTPTLLAGADQRADHLRAGVRLARARAAPGSRASCDRASVARRTAKSVADSSGHAARTGPPRGAADARKQQVGAASPAASHGSRPAAARDLRSTSSRDHVGTWNTDGGMDLRRAPAPSCTSMRRAPCRSCATTSPNLVGRRCSVSVALAPISISCGG